MAFSRQGANQLDLSYGTTQKIHNVDVITPGATPSAGAPTSDKKTLVTNSNDPRSTLPVEGDVNTGASPAKRDDEADAPGDAESKPQLIAVAIGAISALVLLLLVVIVVVVCRSRRRSKKKQSVHDPLGDHIQKMSMEELKQLHKQESSASISNNQSQLEESHDLLSYANGSVGNGFPIGAFQDELIQTRRLPDLPALARPESGTGTTASSHCKTSHVKHLPNHLHLLMSLCFRHDALARLRRP